MTFDVLFVLGWVIGLVLLPVASFFNTWHVDRMFLKALIEGDYLKDPLITYRLYPPETNEKPMLTMMAFFNSLAANFSGKSVMDVFVEGKWHENISFEIHSNGGSVGFYIVCKEVVKNMLDGLLANHFPGAVLTQVDDPFLTWPDEWTRESSQLAPKLFGVDIVPTQHDINPTAGTRDFQPGQNAPDYDPITQLWSVLEQVDPKSYVAIQMIVRAWSSRSGGLMDEWNEEFKRLRNELTTNTAMSHDEAGRRILNAAQQKMNSEIFKIKFRYVYFMGADEPRGFVQAQFNSFLKQFNGPNQSFCQQKETKTSEKEGGDEHAGRMGDIVAARFAERREKIYWAREQYYREKKIYAGMLKRGFDTGSEPWLIDADSLAALFHFPITSSRVGISESDVARLATDYGQSHHEVHIGNPPANLPG